MKNIIKSILVCAFLLIISPIVIAVCAIIAWEDMK
jgi:hypothetical protein